MLQEREASREWEQERKTPQIHYFSTPKELAGPVQQPRDFLDGAKRVHVGLVQNKVGLLLEHALRALVQSPALLSRVLRRKEETVRSSPGKDSENKMNSRPSGCEQP